VYHGPLGLLANRFLEIHGDHKPDIYAINKEQDASVEFMKQKRWRLTFRRWLHEDLQNQLRRLHDILIVVVQMRKKIELNSIGKNLVFSRLSRLISIFVKMIGLNFKKIWKAKMPLKIKIFMWLVSQNAILSY